jgi:hypothetical protein
VDNVKNIIVFGPGRTGSHWIEKILIDLCGGSGKTIQDITLLPNRWLIHTHDIVDLINTKPQLRDSCILVNSLRRSHFDRAISNLVADKIDEYFKYSSKPIDPFTVDIGNFETAYRFAEIQAAQFNKFMRYRYTHIVDIYYEDLINSANPEEYVAGMLNMSYTQTDRLEQSNSFKNPRNYKNLILNWDDLVAHSETLINTPITTVEKPKYYV